MVAEIWEGIKNIVNSLLDTIMSVLPTSPFRPHIDDLANIPYLGYINWFVPVGTFIAIGGTYLAAVGMYYIYMIALRWIKAIE